MAADSVNTRNRYIHVMSVTINSPLSTNYRTTRKLVNHLCFKKIISDDLNSEKIVFNILNYTYVSTMQSERRGDRWFFSEMKIMIKTQFLNISLFRRAAKGLNPPLSLELSCHIFWGFFFELQIKLFFS